MVGRDGCAVYFVLPVGVGCTQQLCSVAVLAVVRFYEVAVFVAVEHVILVGEHRHRHVARVAYLRFLVAASFLSGDDDNTVRATRTIDGGSRGILQYCEAFDIIRVHHTQAVRSTLDTLVVESHTIDNNQRVVACVERRTATYTDRGSTARTAVVCCNVYTCNLALHHLLCRCYKSMVLLVWLKGCNRTCEVVLLGNTITDNDNVVKCC